MSEECQYYYNDSSFWGYGYTCLLKQSEGKDSSGQLRRTDGAAHIPRYVCARLTHRRSGHPPLLRRCAANFERHSSRLRRAGNAGPHLSGTGAAVRSANPGRQK